MSKVYHLLVIDPQGSFIHTVGKGTPLEMSTEQQRLHDGELCVGGASQPLQF